MASATTLGRGGSRASDYIKPTPTPSPVYKPKVIYTPKTTPSVTPNRQPINTTPTVVEQEEPSWLGDGPVGGGGSRDTRITSNDYYQKMLDDQQKAIQTRIDSAVQANNAYKDPINQRSDQSLQNAYILREQSKVNAPQALSAMGIQGGAAESSLLGINTGYENTRNEVEQNRQNSLNEIYQNEQQIRATGDATLSEASADYYNKLVQAQQQAEAAAQDQANWQANYDLDAKQYEDAAAQQAWQNQYDERVLKYNQSKSSGSGGSGGSGGKTKTEAFADDYAEVTSGRMRPETVIANERNLIAQYGLSQYNQLLEAAKRAYQYRAGNPVADFRILAGEQ
jgi:hypothetical protein